MKKKFKLCYIEWEDACIYGSHTQDFGDYFPLMKIASAGILIYEDKKQITLAMDWNHKGGEGQDGRTIQSYPKTCIKKMKTFDLTL